MARAPDALPLEDLYARYLIMFMDSERDYRPALRVARVLFSENSHLRLYALAERATSADVHIQTRGNGTH